MQEIYNKWQLKGKDLGKNEPYQFTKSELLDFAKEYHKEKLRIGGVNGRLLEIDLIDWEHNCGDGCCYSYGQDITLNGEKLDEQNAEDSKNALTAVLTSLGYEVEINYR